MKSRTEELKESIKYLWDSISIQDRLIVDRLIQNTIELHDLEMRGMS